MIGLISPYRTGSFLYRDSQHKGPKIEIKSNCNN